MHRFLKGNRHPAIFMGDSGSLVLGLALGVVSLFAIARSTLFISLLVPPILAAEFPSRTPPWPSSGNARTNASGGYGHIHHRLYEQDSRKNATVGIMWAWTAALSVCSIVLRRNRRLRARYSHHHGGCDFWIRYRKTHLPLNPCCVIIYSPRHAESEEKRSRSVGDFSNALYSPCEESSYQTKGSDLR